MRIFKGWATTALVCVGGSGAFAGGIEFDRLPMSMMFETGNYVSLAYRSTSIDASDNVYSPNGSMYVTTSTITPSFKYQINDRLSVGLTRYQSANVNLSYVGKGGPFDSTTFETISANQLNTGGVFLPEPTLSLTAHTTALIAGYNINDSISVLAGLKRTEAEASGNILTSPYGDFVAEKGTDNSYVVGASFSKPEIALRVTAYYESRVDITHSMSATGTVAGFNVAAGAGTFADTTSALPETLTIDFQTGIAADTLLFGSIKRALWSNAHIFMYNGAATAGGMAAGLSYAAALTMEQKTTHTNSTTLNLGLGRKLTDKWAISASVNYEKGTAATGTSLLTTTNGQKGITLGAKYTNGQMTVTGGVNYTQLGDKSVSSFHGTGTLAGGDFVAIPGNFTNSSSTTIGIKVGYNF
jgi:long-chain fatty acid transport protein